MTDVLSRSKVEITWDAKDKKRQKTILDQFKSHDEVNRDLVQHLVASESEEGIVYFIFDTITYHSLL